MTHPCVKCGKEISEYLSDPSWVTHCTRCYEHLKYHNFTNNYNEPVVIFGYCMNQSCPAYSFLQAGLEPITDNK